MNSAFGYIYPFYRYLFKFSTVLYAAALFMITAPRSVYAGQVDVPVKSSGERTVIMEVLNSAGAAVSGSGGREIVFSFGEPGGIGEISGVAAVALRSGKPFDDIIPPGPVTDLAGLITDENNVQLSWTAPGDDGYVDGLDDSVFRIRWATYNVSNWEADWDNSGGAWSDYSNKYNVDISTDGVQAGSQHFFTAEGLTEDIIYYFHIWTRDNNNNWSDISNTVTLSISSLDPIVTLEATTGSLDGEVQLTLTSVGGNEYEIRYSINAPEAGKEYKWWEDALPYAVTHSPRPKDEEQKITLFDLTPGTTYFITMRAKYLQSISPIGEFVDVAAGDAVPAAPEGLDLVWTVNEEVRVTWNKNIEPDINEYEIWRSTEGGAFEHIASTSASVYCDGKVETYTSYVYKIRVVDNTGHISPYSEEKDVFTGEVLYFGDVANIRIISRNAGSMTFGWDPVSESPALEGYIIEKTQSLRSPLWLNVGSVSSTETLRLTVSLSGDTYYYRIITVAKSEKTSLGLVCIDTSDDGNLWYVSSDNNAFLRVPYSFAQELYSGSNQNGVTLSIDRREEKEGFLMSYRVKASRNGSEIEGFRFNNTRKGAELIISYSGLVQAGALSTSEDRQLAMFWHNGVKWMKLGGGSDLRSRLVRTYSRRLGSFAIGLSELSSEFRLNYVEPKIFTPEEGDYRINEVSFYFENPQFLEVTIRIFDVNGREIRKNLRRDGENKLIWDGRDESGKIVRGGVYIYQVEADGKVINGTVVVAK